MNEPGATSVKRDIIITADDYGMCASVNEAIDECISLGTITSTNVMVNMPARRDAITFRTRHPGVALGLHWTLCQGDPVLPAASVPSLVGADGRFHSSRDLRQRWRNGLVRAEELEAELRAQYRRFVELAGAPDYWNTHENTHVYPGLFDLFVDVAASLEIPRMRCHRRHVVAKRGGAAAHLALHPVFALKGAVIGWYSRRAERRGMWMPRALISSAGFDKYSEIEAILHGTRPSPGRPLELVVHPATRPEPSVFGALVESRLAEYRTLRQRGLRQRLADAGIHLVTLRAAA